MPRDRRGLRRAGARRPQSERRVALDPWVDVQQRLQLAALLDGLVIHVHTHRFHDPIHAAGGRHHYNSVRQFRTELRRIEILCFLAESGVSLLARGTQRALAQRFGVSEATISRDLVGILAERSHHLRCPFCGAKPLDEDGVLAIQEGHDRFRRWLGLPHEDGTDPS
jgi:hypothetical protein